MNIQEISKIVNKIITEKDPLHFIELGFPKDEYDIEIGEISYKIVNKRDGEKVVDIVKSVFKEKFDEETMLSCIQSLESISDEIERAIS